MKYSRTMLVELKDVDAVLIRTFPKQFDTAFDYYFHAVGDTWMVWPRGRDPTAHVLEFAVKHLDGEIRTRRVELGQTLLDDFAIGEGECDRRAGTRDVSTAD